MCSRQGSDTPLQGRISALAADLLECVPNVSEGRDPARIARCADALRRGGAQLLHQTSDTDHHRTVFTLAGSAQELVRSLEGLFEVAMGEIDSRQHRGVHPRIGAVDVVPFVPLDTLQAAHGQRPLGALADARRLARAFGERLGHRFDLPVLLYGEAARSAERRDLARLRRGGFEALAERLAAEAPDAGPARPHPTAGACAVGARFFLVAFNVVLATSDVRVAKRIAARVRERGGGLPAVKALGLPLASRGLVQVSMNLVDYRRTSPHRAVEAVRREAERLGVEMLESELIGLIPRAALADGPLEDLGLAEFSDAMVLENRLASAGLIQTDPTDRPLTKADDQSRLPPSRPARHR